MNSDANKICRKRKARNDKLKNHYETYKNFCFSKHLSSGRPGSPHRYFADSYFASFNDGGITEESLSTNQSDGQIIHRHLNGLCIVTVGRTLQKYANNATISSVKYRVHVSQNAQSARGKLRAKHGRNKLGKKQPSPDNIESNLEYTHDGTVDPNDALCTITLSNGVEYEFKCCVSGTVLEVNNRLIDFNWDGRSQNSPCHKAETHRPSDPSLLLVDPLLDGYLAVILPKGPFPPSKR